MIPLQGGAVPNVLSSESILRSTEAYFRDGRCTRDERFKSFAAMMRRGVASDFDFTSPEEMKRHPYYQEFLQPVGLQYFGGVKMAAGDDLWCVSIQRSAQQGAFSPIELRKLGGHSQQFASAAALARALGFAAANAAVEALELSGSAVALLNRRGEVLRLNRGAEALLSPDLRVVERRIISQDREATAALDRALHSLLWTGTSSALMPSVKSEESQKIRAILVARSRLVAMRRDIENHVRSMIKEYGCCSRRAIGLQFRNHVSRAVGQGSSAPQS